jgi:A/G-specific adenine glycosylase
MLQQTTIAAVMPYFERFRKEFPTVEHLAAADEAHVLRLWEGLGYYSRARNLHKAAGVIVNDLDGRFPETVDELLKLPGVGPYTSRAIASVALGQGVGILEANTLRLYSRLIELDINPRSKAGNSLLWKFADWVVAPRSASAFNQAAMDIGSTVCTPDNPSCANCPLKTSCCSLKNNRQHELPVAPAKKQMTDVTEVAFVLRRSTNVLMQQYQTGERWAGLWDFVRFPVSVDEGDQLLHLRADPAGGQQALFANEAAPLAERIARQQTGLQVESPEMIKQIRHTVTRYRIRLLCLYSEKISGSLNRSSGLKWMAVERLDALPLSTTARRIATLIQERN